MTFTKALIAASLAAAMAGAIEVSQATETGASTGTDGTTPLQIINLTEATDSNYVPICINKLTLTLSGHDFGGRAALYQMTANSSLFQGLAYFEMRTSWLTSYDVCQYPGSATSPETYCTDYPNAVTDTVYDWMKAHTYLQFYELDKAQRTSYIDSLENLANVPMYYSVSESGPRHVADTERLQAMWDEYSPGNSHFADHTGKADDVMLVDEGATALEYLYGKLEYSPKARSAVPLEHGTEYKFDQELIFNEISNPHAGGTFGDLEAAKWGRIYVPHKCADATSTQCHMHIYIRGNDGSNGSEQPHNFNKFAAMNDIIIAELYINKPNVGKTPEEDFLDKRGPRIRDSLVHQFQLALIDALSSKCVVSACSNDLQEVSMTNTLNEQVQLWWHGEGGELEDYGTIAANAYDEIVYAFVGHVLSATTADTTALSIDDTDMWTVASSTTQGQAISVSISTMSTV